MFNIDSFLGKFKNFVLTAGLPKKRILAALATEGIVLDERALTLREGTLYIKAHPVVKNQIYLKKDKLLKLFKADQLTERISDIR